MTTSKKAKEKHIDIDSITIKAGAGPSRPFFGNIEATLFEKLYKKIMKFKKEIYFEYNHLEKTFVNEEDNRDLVTFTRMIKEAQRLGNLYKEMYSEDPKYLLSFQHFKNDELKEWMEPRLNTLFEVNEHHHFAVDEKTGELTLYFGLDYEKYKVKKRNIIFFNKEVNETDEAVTPIDTTFSISHANKLSTTRNIQRMADTLYRVAYAMDTNVEPLSIDAYPIQGIRFTINMEDYLKNKAVLELD
jgi:hypothetical protein